MTMPTIATRKPNRNGIRQPHATKASCVISDLTKITEPKPSRSPIGMAKPTHALQKARNRERDACSITQVEAVPNSAPKLMPWTSRNRISSAGAVTPIES
jgi:hypothetical protein